MAREKVVVDASVVVKWFLEEAYSDKALLLRDKYISGQIRLASPSIMPYEVLNALRYSGVYSKEELAGVVRSLERYGIELWELRRGYGERVAEVAIELDISIYDAGYAALAQITNARLVTADEEIMTKAKNLIDVKHVKDLE
jgi:predicted nucleic acid-binding protein